MTAGASVGKEKSVELNSLQSVPWHMCDYFSLFQDNPDQTRSGHTSFSDIENLYAVIINFRK